MVVGLITSLRPKQWTKNLLVFAALIFSKKLFPGSASWDPDGLWLTFLAFVSFCLASGAVYLVNDVADRQSDRLHPQKRLRPIAAGRVPVAVALAAAVGCAVASHAIGFWLDWRFGAVITGYTAMQLGYTFRLKRVVVLDVMIVAAGFALRAISGTFVVHVDLSPWLFVCAILLALFLALAKRRHELLFLEGGGISHRSVLGKYSEPLLDQMMAVATSATVIAYCLYTLAEETRAKFGTEWLILTVPFVLYGIYRYLYLVYRKEQGGAPEKVLLTDLPLLIDIVLYLASVALILSFGKGLGASPAR
ncbi:decaprenyl-phosphate phosphoribosyltransferase [candidate division WOR-3 bacterium]|nr:decaprenyl-phosphate phosphoribosyltransferase [candidate division WOR-3 bacterium]